MPPLPGLERKDIWSYLGLPASTLAPPLPPTWRAKDVGGNRPPRTPMGTEPLLGSAGGGGCTKSGSRRHTHKRFLPSFRPHGCVKPYCCLSDCIGFLLRAQDAIVSLELGVDGCPLGSPPFYVR